KADAERLHAVMEAVEVIDVVLRGVALYVGVVQAVLELLELSPQLAPLPHDGPHGRRVALPARPARIVAQRLLRGLALRFEGHDAIEHGVVRGRRVTPFGSGDERRSGQRGI